MQRFIFDRLNVSLLNIPEGQKQANAYVERSHRTDDEEFYAINLSRATSQKAFLAMAQDWIYTYNYKRPHFGVNMAGRTPMEAARFFHSMCHVAIGAMPVVILDQLSMHIGELFDLSKIPWDNSPRNIKILNETMAYYNYNILCSLGWGVIPGILPLFATGLPSTSLRSIVMSMGGALVI